MLFSRWGAFVYRFRKVISILTLVLARRVRCVLVVADCRCAVRRRLDRTLTRNRSS